MTDRMPVLFLGHGSPMNAIEDNEYRRSWQSLGAEFGTSRPRPKMILCVSAHWLTHGWWVTGMDKPRTIHDFGGFPPELFAQQYPAPGSPTMAKAISAGIAQPAVGLDTKWGLDHGTWSVLKPMFPKADIPVVQLSMDYSHPPSEHYALGKELKKLREQGVLIVGSGNIVHNLRAARREVANNQAYSWAAEFDGTIAAQIEKGDLAALANFEKMGQVAQMAHPTYDHFLPLLYTAGAVDAKEPVKFFNDKYQLASISMRSVVWG
ncbi:4,5-DOPA dioxygenase extradiol [Caenimonas koreensis DSM 17982]|uniref:4,5-DOPA dioxygenase extradiol n=1 Tax=Caenimonas koreensis DSM 17982 TaxID=1121255 RepID=A0A844APJ1_9BURK|nr:4,5-DOPA dioxygenase extradiol [Caenimonas koreensis]MRD45834.1 4,5-DOPA dioxygenase extradiol [Caenimonas koreensis DSM 17982]